MRDSQLNGSERAVQPKFRLAAPLVAAVLLPVLIILTAGQLRGMPSRQPLPDRVASVRYQSLDVAGTSGAWTVSVDDPRFGGASALAVDGARLLALTDSGVVVSLPKPRRGGRAWLHDLPDGPGSPHERRWRDSEALLRDRSGSWWVAFESRHSLWRYDSRFAHVEAATALDPHGKWALNEGVEALVSHGPGRLLLLPEDGTELLRFSPHGTARTQLLGAQGEIADAARLPNGRVLVLVRQAGATGLVNQLGELSPDRDGGRVQLLWRIPVGPLTNMEGLAAERLPSGGTRLWLISDNDFSDLRRTVLLTVDLPGTDRPKASATPK
jgi:hypothetical protein